MKEDERKKDKEKEETEKVREDEISTTQRMKLSLKMIKDFEMFRRKYHNKYISISLPKFIDQIIDEKKLKRSEVIEEAQIAESYGYQILNGTRKTGRQNICAIAFGLRMNEEEADKLFFVARKVPLHPKIENEAAVLYCLNNRYRFYDCLLLLERYGLAFIDD